MNCRDLLGSVAATLFCATLAAADTNTLPLVLETQPVPLLDSADSDVAIERIRARGMLALPAVKIGAARLSQLSGLAWDDDDGILYAVSDKGWLFHLKPLFDRDTLTGISVTKVVELIEPARNKSKQWRLDSEGLEIKNGRNGRKGDAELLVSSERTPRIVRYRPDGHLLGELALPTTLVDIAAYQNANHVLEAVCVDKKLGILTVPEAPLTDDSDGTTRIFDLTGKRWRYTPTRSNRITAIECLGQSQVLVLERDFGLARSAVSLVLATLPGTPDAESIQVKRMVVLDSANGHQIDNFEGLARHKGERFFMVSDNNDLFVQRTLLLYFELTER
jgi:hypothetical protein